MKNFDEARAERAKRDRSFTIGGETFTYRASVAPEALLNWNSASEEETTEAEWLKLWDETITAFLEPGQDELWKHVRALHAADPLSIEDMTDVIQWLFQEAARRPTGPPSDSSASSDGSGTKSKDASSSLAAVS